MEVGCSIRVPVRARRGASHVVEDVFYTAVVPWGSRGEFLRFSAVGWCSVEPRGGGKRKQKKKKRNPYSNPCTAKGCCQSRSRSPPPPPPHVFSRNMPRSFQFRESPPPASTCRWSPSSGYHRKRLSIVHNTIAVHRTSTERFVVCSAESFCFIFRFSRLVIYFLSFFVGRFEKV